MYTWKLDSTGDFVFTNGDMEIVAGDDELLQSVRHTLRTNLGEYFLNPDFGFARYEALGEKYDHNRIKDAVYAAILSVPRVTAVNDVHSFYDGENRKLLITFTFTKGETEITGEVQI